MIKINDHDKIKVLVTVDIKILSLDIIEALVKISFTLIVTMVLYALIS